MALFRYQRIVLAFVLAMMLCAGAASAQEKKNDGDGLVPTVSFLDRDENPKKVVTTLEILFLLTILSLAPAIMVLMTSFTRIVIVLSFVRRALATQDLPPNQVITGLSLILTFMVMMPTFQAIKRDALDPYTAEEPSKQITQGEAFDRAVFHMRQFMFQQVRMKDIRLFLDISGKSGEIKGDVTKADVPTEVLIPAFVISELRRAFIMGFALFIPFVVIDLVVATTLISMGMLVLPPILISMPFKILLFILVDGWHLIIGSLVKSFAVGSA